MHAGTLAGEEGCEPVPTPPELLSASASGSRTRSRLCPCGKNSINKPSKEASAPGATHRSPHSCFRTFENFPPLSENNPNSSLGRQTHCSVTPADLASFPPIHPTCQSHYRVSPPHKISYMGSFLTGMPFSLLFIWILSISSFKTLADGSS